MSIPARRERWRLTGSVRALAWLLALFLLNSALTFHNRWPTAGVRWTPELSLDFTVLLLGLALAAAWWDLTNRRWRNGVLAAFILLTLGRYLDVTAPALMGRSLDLYWDAPHIPAVANLLLDQVAGWRILFGGLALLALLATLFLGLRWAVGVLLTALTQPSTRYALGALALALLSAYGAGRLSARLPTEYAFSLPVTPLLVGQLRSVLAATVWRDNRWLAAAAPLPDSDLSRFGHGDVFVIFFESQGALIFDDPRFAAPLVDDFAVLEHALTADGWRMATARVESSTFGGLSWLAHSSLLSGVRIADPSQYRDLLASTHPTLVGRFAAAGYRTVALMPGLRHAWPEGQFYGFSTILDAARLDYRGPAYGGWAIPDQYSLYRLHQTEIALPDRRPLFVFFPTINSHMPFAPTPPYQADWSQLSALPEPPPQAATGGLSERLDGVALAAAYIASVRYNLQVLDGYLRHHAPADALIVALGDHQPPAIVGGRDISWQTPMHIFSRNPELIAALQAAGFQAGMTPGAQAWGGIEALGPLLLRLLDSRRASATDFPASSPLTTLRAPDEPARAHPQ